VALWLTARQAETLGRMVGYVLRQVDSGQLKASAEGTAILRALLPHIQWVQKLAAGELQAE